MFKTSIKILAETKKKTQHINFHFPSTIHKVWEYLETKVTFTLTNGFVCTTAWWWVELCAVS